MIEASLTDNVCSFFGHVDEISATSWGEFYSVDDTFGSNDIGDMTNASATGRSQVQDLFTRSNIDVIQPSQNTGGEF